MRGIRKKNFSRMKESSASKEEWYALRTANESRLAEMLAGKGVEVYCPTRKSRPSGGGKPRELALIPHVIFIRTRRSIALRLEAKGRKESDPMPMFWIYRYKKGDRIQGIPLYQMRLLQLLSADDSTRCEIYRKADFERGERVRIIGGTFKGLEGNVQRVKKNKHVVVRIEGVCAVMLPFIHPDLLEHIS